ncbi:hypothetical protein HYH03_016267 [Edaphochlamys debaryana]|uniref:BTB domain-containing protein n=1 Tax=Edaphochlamys debaryana TaxID=47281 RepID=A0A835XQ54_9CHLO|nr:hypothetical protein HYH03_016267 [Edaphochlamys debaryana]|eukprot:KAG2484970.1 hypothetical protein HYH03_016267 [Edaphochlamys debaryana]
MGNAAKNVTRTEASHTFWSGQPDWGFSQFIPLARLACEPGFLRAGDGALIVRVEVGLGGAQPNRPPAKPSRPSLPAPAPEAPPAAPPRESVGGDLLALLERPGATSDVTLVAGGRSFPAHRAILAARSDFFARLFDSGMSDSSSREVALPDVDPDALVLLLRYMYGVVVEACAPAVLRPAAELADRLLLPAASASLQQRLVAATCPDRLLDDMAWAEARGYGTMLAALEPLYRRDAAKVPSEQVEALAERSPKLMARLHLLLLGRG